MTRLPSKAWVADLMTLGNGIFGFLSIVTWSVELGPLEGFDDRFVAAAYIGLGMVADGFDGIVARRWGSTGLGNALDTACDSITFCVAPAVFLLEAHSGARGSALGAATAVVAVAFLVAGLLRLARQQNAEGDAFVGLPTPWSGATLVVVLLLATPPWVALAAAVLLGALNLSRVAYPKTRGRMTRAAVIILVLALAVIATLVLFPGQARLVLGAGLVLALGMVFLAPLFARGSHERPPP